MPEPLLPNWRGVVPEHLLRALDEAPIPSLAVSQLARLIDQSTNAATFCDGLASSPQGALFVRLLGCSRQLGNTVAQNPEFASLILESDLLLQPFSIEAERAVCTRLLASATSTDHKLDRLRFIKQQWTLRLAARDLAGLVPPAATWQDLSDLASLLIEQTLHVVWAKQSADNGLEGRPPISIAAFGKLGGGELNYSSDVDLAYVIADEADEKMERQAVRLAESLGRALAQRMGRGAITRVDVRLRPYGGTGPLVNRMKSVEAYYRKYAEPWEVLALIRSRILIGPEEIQVRWNAMRAAACFSGVPGQWAVESILAMRKRIDGIARPDDLKRSPGGIRDVEFITQLLQLATGHQSVTLRERATLPTLQALSEHGVLPVVVADRLSAAYTLYRQTEHRIQWMDDRQTHTLPESPSEREALAKSLHFDDFADLESRLREEAQFVRGTYSDLFAVSEDSPDDARTKIQSAGPDVLAWVDSTATPELAAATLVENRDSLGRLEVLAKCAPALRELLTQDSVLFEHVLSGEILEPLSPMVWPTSTTSQAAMIRRRWARLIVQGVLEPEVTVCTELSELVGAVLRNVVQHPALGVIGLGSLAARELSPDSDVDLLLLADDASDFESLERAAQELLRSIAELRTHGAPLRVDLRLRPEGSKGLLVRSLGGFLTYELGDMEPWERMALSRSAPVACSDELFRVVRQAAFNLKLTPEALGELDRVKLRVENERLSPALRMRQIKLGYGGTMDLEWALQLLLLAGANEFPLDLDAATIPRIEFAVQAGWVGASEGAQMAQAWRHHQRLRFAIPLLGYEPDVLPENPDKLATLAHVAGFESANALLAVDQSVRATTREHLQTIRERLKH